VTIANAGRCRICSANDEAGLIEHLAETLWERRREEGIPPWAEAGEFWHDRFREHATIFVQAART
jgi:hypothetical protein